MNVLFCINYIETGHGACGQLNAKDIRDKDKTCKGKQRGPYISSIFVPGAQVNEIFGPGGTKIGRSTFFTVI